MVFFISFLQFKDESEGNTKKESMKFGMMSPHIRINDNDEERMIFQNVQPFSVTTAA